jgi:hypothetical protein
MVRHRRRAHVGRDRVAAAIRLWRPRHAVYRTLPAVGLQVAFRLSSCGGAAVARLPGMRLLVVAALVASSTHPAAAKGGGILIPPAEVDVGVGTAVGGAALVGPSSDVLAGVHWASLAWKPTSFDVGVGFVGSYRAVLPRFAIERTTMPSPGSDDNRLSLAGAYLDLAYALENHAHWRTWMAARIETLHASVNGQSFNALGAAVRIATEVYVSGAAGGGGHDGFAVVAGALALGFYVEGVRRDLPSELGPVGVAAGVTMRVPFMAALVD